MLRLHKARGDGDSIRNMQSTIFHRLKGKDESEDELARWLQSEGLTGSEEFLSVSAAPRFQTGRWQQGAGGSPQWIDEAIGLLQVGSGIHVQCTESLNPHPGSNWFLEIAFTVRDLRHESWRNTIFSQHGPGTGWELRVDRHRGIEFIWTTEHGGHNERCCGLGSAIGEWVHVAVAFLAEPSQLRVFVNGQASSPYTVRGGFVPDEQLPRLGMNPHWQDRFIEGQVAFARVDQQLPVRTAAELEVHAAWLSRLRLSLLPNFVARRPSFAIEGDSDREELEDGDDDGVDVDSFADSGLED